MAEGIVKWFSEKKDTALLNRKEVKIFLSTIRPLICQGSKHCQKEIGFALILKKAIEVPKQKMYQ